MQRKTIAFDLNHVYFTFIGFVYSLLVALVVETAYLKSGFRSILTITFTCLLLFYFAYDWGARTRNILKIPESMIAKHNYLDWLKKFLDLAVVYTLLVFSLKCVETYSNSLQVQDDYFYYSMAMFAILSGAWNAISISIFEGVNKSDIIDFIRGHLSKNIVKQFPKLIQKWRGEIQLDLDRVHHQMDKLIKKRQFNSNEQILSYRKKWRKLERKLRFMLLRRLWWKPHRLLFPYLFVSHVVVLNFVLGILIVITSYYFDKTSISSQLLSAFGLNLPVWGFAVGLLLSTILLAWHFITIPKMDVDLKERIGCWFIFITMIYGYLLCSAFVLVFLVIAQQVIADIIMNLFFEPQSPPNSVPIT